MSDENNLRGPSVRSIPEGDNRERMICAECGYILYDNPKIVVGSVTRWGERILLCRRSINPRLSQVQLIYRARLLDEAIEPGPESIEVRLFDWEQIPWSELAFPSVSWALQHD